MKNKKNLDDLYRERLLGKEVLPPIDAWENIAGRLPQKGQKRLPFPFWYKVAGVAIIAILAGSLAVTRFDSPAANSGPSSYRISTQTRPDFREIESNAFRSFNEQMLNAAALLENIIRENSSLKNDKKPQELIAYEDIVAEKRRIIGITSPSEQSGTDSNSVQKNTSEEIVATAAKEVEDDEYSEEVLMREFSGNEVTHVSGKTEPEVEIAPGSESKLSISPKFAPLFFNSREDGSSIGSSLAYGLSISFRLSDKVAVRAGVNKISVAASEPSLQYTGGVQAGATANKSTALASPEIERLEQNPGFIELPVEMEYALLDNKIKVNLIGGSSLLFFNQNKNFETTSPGEIQEEKENHEGLNYTANLGVGLGYNLFKNLDVNLEPIMKFRLGNSGHMSPSYFGIYSGFTYRF